MSSQMVLFGQPLIKIREAIWQNGISSCFFILFRNFILLSLCSTTVKYCPSFLYYNIGPFMLCVLSGFWLSISSEIEGGHISS